jgi:SAM-dependent methyltransferase
MTKMSTSTDTNYYKSRDAKARKIISIVKDASLDVSASRCLDLGCGNGVITDRLCSVVGWIVGVDLDWELISQAPSHLNRVQADALYLPFCDAAFDFVVCTQVYEHVKDMTRLVNEITRILKPGGVCYFSGPNRLWPYESHYKAWMIHWLPHQWQKRLFHHIGRRRDMPPVRLYNYWQLRRFWRHFLLRDYTLHLIRYPDRFPGADVPDWVRYIPECILAMVIWITPNVNWVLIKPLDEKGDHHR